jgi:diacylglycerol O-acyltransferase
MSALDATFYFAESETTPMHVGSVSVFEGPAPSYGELVRLLLGKLPLVPRYRQRVRSVPLHLGRPLWVDDEHFQILYHVRHTAVPAPGGAEELRNLAGRVLGQRLDMAKPLWEVWLVEGLAKGRWAVISKVHHCMVDGVAGTDLMQAVFDVDPDAEQAEPAPWTPARGPSTAALVADSVREAATYPMSRVAAASGRLADTPKALLRAGSALGAGVPAVARQIATPVARSLNGRIGPHRRWAWTETRLDEVKKVRAGLGGSINDVVLAAITRGFRDLLAARGPLEDGLVVRSMVPVSVRKPNQKGGNQVSAVLVDLPVGEPDPRKRLAALRVQMDEHKKVLQAVDAAAITGLADFAAPTLMALGTRAAMRTGQQWFQAVTTNVPGPRVPLYVLGRRMLEMHPYVPIGGGMRCSIGIFSYLEAMTFGINVDFDAFPDVDVLANGIHDGMAELAEIATARLAQSSAG